MADNLQPLLVASKEVPFINGFNSIFELFIPYIQKESLNADAANKFFGGILLNRTINRETKMIIPLMALILENNDLAAPIFMLQLMKVKILRSLENRTCIRKVTENLKNCQREIIGFY